MSACTVPIPLTCIQMAGACTDFEEIAMQAWASECVLEMAVPPVAASAYWTLQSAAAMVATQLGTTLRYIMQQHSMWHMAQVGITVHLCEACLVQTLLKACLSGVSTLSW